MEYKVGDCFTYIRNGANIKQDKLAGGIPITRIETLSNDTFNRDKMGYAGIQNYEKYKSYLLQDGDILMSHINSARFLGRAVVYHKEGHEKIIHGMNLLLLKARLDIINPEYAVLVFKSEIFKRALQKIIKKSVNQASFAVSDLKKLKIEVPVLSEQEKIVEEFYKLNRILKSRTKELNTFDELVKARFVEMFGDPIHNDKNWPLDTVESLCKEIYGGGTPSKSHPEYYENGNIPWISSKDMKTDVLTGSQIYINQLGVDNSTAKMVPANSVIMVIRSGILKHTLPVAINAIPVTVNQDLKVFIPCDRVLPRFLAIQFKMQEKDILSGVRAVTADNIEFDSLKKRSLIVPPIELQLKYIDFLNSIDKSKFAKSTEVFLVRNPHIVLVHHGVMHGRVNLLVPQQLLNLLYGHPLVYGPSGHRAPEFMGMDLFNVDTTAQLPQSDFYTADLQPVVRSIQGHK